METTTTYIINPWMIYLIEQLHSVDGLLFLLTITSLITTGISLYLVLSKLHRDEHNNSYYGYSSSCSIADHLANIEDVCLDIKTYNEKISKELSKINNKKSLTDNEKEGISLTLRDNLSRTNNSLAKLNNLNDIVNHNIACFINYKKILKISLIVLASTLLLNTFIPSKESAYKILMSTYLTQENISAAGNVTTDIANSIVDKLTDSIIKIKEAGK